MAWVVVARETGLACPVKSRLLCPATRLAGTAGGKAAGEVNSPPEVYLRTVEVKLVASGVMRVVRVAEVGW